MADSTTTTTTATRIMKPQEVKPTTSLGPEDVDPELIREEKEQRACKISVTVVVPPSDEQSPHPWYYGLHLVDRTILCDDGIMSNQKTVCAIERSLQTTTTTTTTNNINDNDNCDYLLKGSPLREGDILTTVNNGKVKNSKVAINRLDRLKNNNNKKNGGSTTVTLVVEPPMQQHQQHQQQSSSSSLSSSSSSSSVTTCDESFNVNPAIVQAFCRKPTMETMVGIGFHTVNVPTPTPNAAVDTDKMATTDSNNKRDDKSETSSATTVTAMNDLIEDDDQDCWDEEGDEIETENQKRKTSPIPTSSSSSSTSFLQINYLDPNGLLSHSVLNQGDTVLFINGISMEDTTPEDAASIVRNSKNGFVDIVALNPKLLKQYSQEQEQQLYSGGNTNRIQRWMKHAKRAGVAVGGGAMVGVGLVFIPTLPPPFGEVLILGGVSVLGTEFEAPKLVMKSARDKLESVVGRNEENNDDNDDEEEEDEEKVGKCGGKSDSEDGSINNNTTTASGIAIATATNISKSEELLSKDYVFIPSVCHQNNSAPEASDPRNDVASTCSDDTNNNNNNESNSNTNTSSNKRTMKDRMRGFGRQYVLPFLDQVVGDRKEVEINQDVVQKIQEKESNE